MKCHYKPIGIAKTFLNKMIISTGKDTENLQLSDFLWEHKMLHTL